MVSQNVGFGFDVGDGTTIMGHSFVWWVGIWSTFQTLDEFPHVWTIWIRHCILKEVFPAFCLYLVDNLGGFINPFLLVLMDWPMEAISSRILACTCGVIQGLDFLLWFDFPTWTVAAEMRISLKWDIQRDRFGSSEDYLFLTQPLS